MQSDCSHVQMISHNFLLFWSFPGSLSSPISQHSDLILQRTTGCDTKFINVSEQQGWEGPGPCAEVLIWQCCSLQLSGSPAAAAPAPASERASEPHAPLSSFPRLSVRGRAPLRANCMGPVVKKWHDTALQVQFKCSPTRTALAVRHRVTPSLSKRGCHVHFCTNEESIIAFQ